MPTTAQLFDQAVYHHQGGDLAGAEKLYRQILEADPQHAGAWHLLGLIAMQVGRLDMAVEYIGQALRLNPGFAEAHSNLGLAFYNQGKRQEAEASCREALRLKPDIVEAYNNLGIVLLEQGKLDEAEASCREALRYKPGYADAHYNLGLVLRGQAKPGMAETCFRDALLLNPDFVAAHDNLVSVLRDQGKADEAESSCRETLRRWPYLAEAHYTLSCILLDQGKADEAEASCREALRCKPGYAEAHNYLGIIFYQQGKPQESEICFHNALRLKPDYAEPHSNLGSIFRGQGKLDEAEACYREALRVKPDYAAVHSNLGAVLWDQGKAEEAEACCREALRIEPANAEAHYNLGRILGDQGNQEEAESCYRKAFNLKPGYAEAHYNLSLLLLLQGNFAQGCPEYEWRRLTKDKLGNAPPPPNWDGNHLNGQTILLQAEEGAGDTFQFVRYARVVQAKGGRVVLQCDPALTRILAACPGVGQVVAEGTPVPGFHLRVPLLSMPMLCKTTLETIPAKVPYLTVDPARVDSWRARLADLPGFKVGICWQGNPEFRGDRLRSVPLASFAPLVTVPRVCLIALQRGPSLEQIAQQSESLPIVDLHDRSEDPAEGWLDTAALIQALDLVISVDTAVVHLAGALGAPVWVALPFMPDWRWLLNREDSPWYPTVRLFRQRKPGDWPEVFQRIAVALKNLIAIRGTAHRVT